MDWIQFNIKILGSVVVLIIVHLTVIYGLNSNNELFSRENQRPLSNIIGPFQFLRKEGIKNSRNVRHAMPPCQHKNDGLVPDYQLACRFFVLCQGGRQIGKFQCPNDTVFDAVTGRCDLPSVVTCDLSKSVSFVADEECANMEDGVYTDYKNSCKGFYICKGGRKITFNCPKDTLFDWRTNTCKPNDQVRCQKLDCKDKEDGRFYSDHKDGCKRYYSCTKGRKFEFVCPPGKIYNDGTQSCENQKDAKCVYNDEEFNCHGLPDGYYPQHQNSCSFFHLCINSRVRTYACPENRMFSSLPLACDYRRRAICDKPVASECSNKPNGVYPRYEKGCQEFVICRDGQALLAGVCLQGKILNPVTGICQPRSNVVCAPVKDPDCSGRSDGLYPDATTNCSAFYVCLSEKRIVTTFCPRGQRFDQATGTCLTSSFVSCQNHLQSESNKFEIMPPAPPTSHLCKGKIGVFPNYMSNCKGYIICVHDHYNFLNCPDGYIFDAKEKKCINNSAEDKCFAPSVIANFQCLSNDGVYEDYSKGCKQWYECWGGNGYAYKCPENTRFQPRTRSCEPSYRTFCLSHLRGENNDGGLNIKSVSGIEKLSGSHLDCQNRPNGVYSSETSCRVFHICAQGIGFSFKCPTETSFDEKTLSCVAKDNANCIHGWSGEVADFSCSDKVDGMYPDYNYNCQRYFICEREEFRIVYCPENHIFSSRTMVCEPEGTDACSPLTDLRELQKTSIYSIRNSFPIYENTPSFQYGSEMSTPLSITPQSNPVPTIIQTLQPEVNELQEGAFNMNPITSVTALPGLSANSNTPFQCPPGAETRFFPDYASACKKFHICFRSLIKTYSCPSMLLFNPYTRNCDVPEIVLCQPPEVPPEGAYNCSDKLYGYYPDYKSGCRKYYGCLNSEILVYTCPPGRFFNQKTMACDLPDLVSCTDPDDLVRTVTLTSSILKLKEAEQRTSTHVHGIPQQYLFNCSDKPDGFYPDYARHCHVFYRCVKGKKFSHYCKQSLLFNPKTGICDFEQNVVCSPPEGTNVKG